MAREWPVSTGLSTWPVVIAIFSVFAAMLQMRFACVQQWMDGCCCGSGWLVQL